MSEAHVTLPASAVDEALARLDRVWLALPPHSPARTDAVAVMRLLRESAAMTASVPAREART